MEANERKWEVWLKTEDKILAGPAQILNPDLDPKDPDRDQASEKRAFLGSLNTQPAQNN
jgi:hypothetical protein